MITGYNTDIEHEGVVYHVQTEDKGLSKPVIMSLIYNRGIILASKRVPYDDLLNGNFDESQLAARLQRQHRLICAAIQAGRIEELKQMSAKEASVESPLGQQRAVPQPTLAGAFVSSSHSLPDFDSPIPKPVLEELPSIISRPMTVSMVEGVNVLDEILLTDEAVSVIADDSLPNQAVTGKLAIQLLSDGRFRGGDRKTIDLKASRGSLGRAVGNAQIMVKVLGSSFRPLIFHASTDANGKAKVDVQLPNFYTGRAAVLVRAISDGEEVELRRVIEHG